MLFHKFSEVFESEYHEHPPVTLIRDLISLVSDPQFADIRFITGNDGKLLYAHKFILQYSCEYFRAMFRSGMMDSRSNQSIGDDDDENSYQMIDIVVPGK